MEDKVGTGVNVLAESNSLFAIDEIVRRHHAYLGSAIPILQDVQNTFGYLSLEMLQRISELTGIPASKLYSIITFYAQFKLEPAGKNVIHVCHGTACHLMGAERVTELFQQETGVEDWGTSPDNMFTLEKVACIGCCSLAPVATVNGEVHPHLTSDKVRKVIKDVRDPEAAKLTAKEGIAGEEEVAAEKIIIVPAEQYRIKVGLATCGIAAGASGVYDAFKDVLQAAKVQPERTGCIGMCYNEPLVEVITEEGKSYTYGKVTPETVQVIIEEHIVKGTPVEDLLVLAQDKDTEDKLFMERQQRILLKNCGQIDPEEIDSYRQAGGYVGLEKALNKMTPAEVIEEIKESGLRGRGGAGFPTHMKWSFAQKAEGEQKYIVCNADEGDPGAFMDRSILESDPHSVLEGMLLAGYAIGADTGYVYIRAEYPLAVHRLNIAIAQAEEKGILGQNIFGTGFDFKIIIREGAGAFVCGEETALLMSIEGKRGMPRSRPPFPAQKGLFGCPTVINNVETFGNVSHIIHQGAAAFNAYGTAKSKGTKVFALAGKVNRGGLIEVPMGITVNEVVFDIGGGISTGKPFKAVQTGGPSGGCIPASLGDTPVDYESLAEIGAIMGSGGLLIMDEETCMVDVAKFFLGFTLEESCGKCTFCRIGTGEMLRILNRIVGGRGKEGDIELLQELGEKIKLGALCGLGQTLPNPVLTTIKYFRDEYDAHIKEGVCPAKNCKALIEYEIVEECKGCGLCIKRCAVEAISGEKKEVHTIDTEKCTRCGLCLDSCKFDAIVVTSKPKG